MKRLLLGVNVDHVATIRQARRVDYPDPVEAALLAESAGADGITLHLREDRRHIQDHDVRRMAEAIRTKLNLEMAATKEMIERAVEIRPADVCLVPERREELTTEGGLDVATQDVTLAEVVSRLQDAAIRVSLFVDPDPVQLEAAAGIGARVVELHTGAYCEASGPARDAELERLRTAATLASKQGLQVNAGHGLHLDNVGPVAQIPDLVELNIGHSIVARAVLLGMKEAVAEMRRALDEARKP